MDTLGEVNAPVKMNATERLTPAYLEKLNRQNGFVTLVAWLIFTSSLVVLLFHIGGDAYSAFISNALCILAALIGAVLAWTATYRARHGALQSGSRYQLAWLLIGAGLLANSLGRAYVTYLTYNKQFNPAPSLADIGFTLFYPLLFAGLVFMLIERRVTRACVKMGLDAAITTFCILGVSWYFFIAPTFFLQRGIHFATATLITTLSYPFWDTLLILATLMILRRCAERLLHPSLLLCCAGLLAAILADTARAHFITLGMYSSVISISPLQVMSALLIGLSASYQYAALAHKASGFGISPQRDAAKRAGAPRGRDEISTRRLMLMRSTLLYLPLGVLLALTLGSEVIHDQERAFFLVVLTVVAGIFMAARYLLAMYENELLLREREGQRQEAERLYLQVDAAHQRLQELDQLKDQFMMIASHELRTPLTCVQGYLELLTEFHDLLSPERHQDLLQKAERSCMELVVLLNNVMDASNLEVSTGIHSTHTEPVLVEEIIRSVINLIEPHLVQEQREALPSIPPDLAVQADPMRLRQVLLNISTNALKYSPAGTPLTFSAQGLEDEVVIRVSDKGKGITSQDQERLFERFVRLESEMNSSVRGSGLGLYISRQLIESMGGKIWIESSGMPGEGTTLHIRLPRASSLPMPLPISGYQNALQA